MSRAPVEKYHIEVSKGIGGNTAIQARRHTARERAGGRKRVTHQLDKTTKNNHAITDTEDIELDHGIHTNNQRTRTHMYMFGLN